MWPFTPEAHLGIASDRLVLRTGRGGRARLHSLEFERGSGLLEAQETGTSDMPYEPVAAWLRMHAPRGARLAITVCDRLVFHLMVRSNAGAATLRERLALANADFERLTGIDAGGWDVAADDDLAAEWFVALAAPRALGQATAAAAARAGLRVSSYTSFFVRRWNLHRRALTEAEFWFSVLGPDSTTLARGERGRVVDVRTLGQGITTLDGLVQLVEREEFRALAAPVARRIYFTGTALASQSESPSIAGRVVALDRKIEPAARAADADAGAFADLVGGTT